MISLMGCVNEKGYNILVIMNNYCPFRNSNFIKSQPFSKKESQDNSNGTLVHVNEQKQS